MGPSGSHWLNLVYLAEGLISKGHDVVSLVPSNLYDNQLKVLNTPTRRKIQLERFEPASDNPGFQLLTSSPSTAVSSGRYSSMLALLEVLELSADTETVRRPEWSAFRNEPADFSRTQLDLRRLADRREHFSDFRSWLPLPAVDSMAEICETPLGTSSPPALNATRQKIGIPVLVPLEGDFFDSMINLQVELSLGDNENQSLLDFKWTFLYEAFKITTSSPIGVEECEVLVFDEKLISKLQQMNFDILIIDPGMNCGNIVARLLNIPLVIMQAPYIMPGFLEYATQAPVPIATFYSFKTDFTQRLKNLAWHCFAAALMRAYTARGDFIMHPPQPAMPNMVYIGGYHVQNISPLPKDLERFLEESGDAGVVVLSFGSYAKVMGRRKAEMLAAGLARVPFKVIWKFRGQRPKNTGKNTLLMDWIPQNDLLAHPKTRVFITQCGINAGYEAMFHGVPVVRVPTFPEQHLNSDNLETLGTGVTLDIFTMTSDDLYEAIMEVANNKTYKSNAVRLAQLHRDQPQSPMDRAVWWIEHVIRHGGLPHLKSAARHLSLLQYHLLDVVALLCVAVVAAGLFLWLCCRYCCRVLCGKKTAVKQKQQ
ncbi:UDP-glucuronosyltransferase 1-1 [Branchiostoma belcheri]|nr:UDP-glucuronosyltransferase 1-1 [Branchiostoma belcheri]